MQTTEMAEFVTRLMTADEVAAFIAGNETERKEQARAAIDRYCAILMRAIEDPQWPAAARQVCLARVLRKSMTVRDLQAA